MHVKRVGLVTISVHRWKNLFFLGYSFVHTTQTSQLVYTTIYQITTCILACGAVRATLAPRMHVKRVGLDWHYIGPSLKKSVFLGCYVYAHTQLVYYSRVCICGATRATLLPRMHAQTSLFISPIDAKRNSQNTYLCTNIPSTTCYTALSIDLITISGLVCIVTVQIFIGAWVTH